MTHSRLVNLRIFISALLLLPTSSVRAADPTLQASTAFDKYVATVESRLSTQHHSPFAFLVPTSGDPGADLIAEQLPGAAPPGALLHHWRATAFVPGAAVADLERLLRDFSGYPQLFAPQVLQARVLSQHGDQLQASMRVRQHHVVTVVLDSTYDISFGQLDPLHRFSASRSNHIAEIASPGTSSERVLTPAEEHGFLWRQNTYWTWEQRDGGLYLQIESISLSRSIPRGLAWAVQPFVESVPRESLEFTLRSICHALNRNTQKEGTK